MLGLSTAVAADQDECWELVPYGATSQRSAAPLRRWFVYHSPARLLTLLGKGGFDLLDVTTRESHRTWLQVLASPRLAPSRKQPFVNLGCGPLGSWCRIVDVGIELRSPAVGELSDVVGVLRDWQHPDAPMQLHPGDLGWFWQFGEDATAAALRTWSLAGRIVALGLLDTPTVLRLTMAPEALDDERLAQHVVADVTDPERGVLPAGPAAVEVHSRAVARDGRWVAVRRCALLAGI